MARGYRTPPPQSINQPASSVTTAVTVGLKQKNQLVLIPHPTTTTTDVTPLTHPFAHPLLPHPLLSSSGCRLVCQRGTEVNCLCLKTFKGISNWEKSQLIQFGEQKMLAYSEQRFNTVSRFCHLLYGCKAGEMW